MSFSTVSTLHLAETRLHPSENWCVQAAATRATTRA